MVHDNDFSSLTKLKEGQDASSSGGMQAAIARTASRGLALYFARPVRLFRPSKVSGWQTLKNVASQQGQSLSPHYFLALIKLQGVGIIPKHFIPPMLVNASLGTVLWGTYGEASSRLEPYLAFHSLSNSAFSGAIAGACQAVVAAPAENVRLLLEGGFGGHSWSCAWKEVFREKRSPLTAATQLNEIRQLRNWFQEVGQMAGRGWEGWGWGCAKDATGFAAFFCIFELSRRAGMKTKAISQDWLSKLHHRTQDDDHFRSQLPAVVNGVTLVTGGVFAGLAYEFMCRPFDIARRAIYLDKLEYQEHSYRILQRRFMDDGLNFFFQSGNLPPACSVKQPSKLARFLRVIARVGPWGAGFLVWEAYGSSGFS